MKPYFLLSKLGREVKAAGKRVRQEPPFGTWYVRYRDEFGKKRRLKTNARTEAEATRRNVEEQETSTDVKAGRRKRRHFSGMLWEALRDAYLKSYAHLSSQAPMKSQFRVWFDPHFKGQPVLGITTADCDALLTAAREAGQKPNTVKQLRIRGRLVFRYAQRRLKAVEDNPWDDVPVPKVPKRARIYLRGEQVDAILLAAGTHRLLILVAVFTGLRRGELGGLKWTDISWTEGAHGIVMVRRSWDNETTKSQKERAVPIHAVLRPELDRAAKKSKSPYVFPAPRKGGMRHESWHVAKLLRSIATRAGVELPEGTTFHTLRATFITRIIHETGDVTAAQRLAGHSTPAVTEGSYLGDDLGYLESAIGRLPLAAASGEHKTNTRPASTPSSKSKPKRKG